MKTLTFLTSGLGDNLLTLPLALELEQSTDAAFVVPAGPQVEFFSTCLPRARIIAHDRSVSSFVRIWSAGAGRRWIYPIGSCTRAVRLLPLLRPGRHAIGFTSLNSAGAWQAEIGLETALMPDLAKRAWRNNLRLLPLLGLGSTRTWDDYVTILAGRLPPAPSDPGRLVIHAGSARYAGGIERYKRWPIERFAAVAERFLNRGEFADVHWILGPDDEDLREPVERAIAAARGRTPMRIVSYREFGGSLVKLFAYLKGAGHMLTNDSGLAHLASLGGTPLTSVSSGLGQPSYTGQNGERSTVVMEPTECYGCAVGISAADAAKFRCGFDWACMDRITVDRVTEAVEASLEKFSDSRQKREITR
ncbi:MAG: hypothetical protein JO102_01575 [Elusimicrobia bacterium]|nr:hypothetical protein [Elusimicrobiota bacterium]